jgi:hypothetical protein
MVLSDLVFPTCVKSHNRWMCKVVKNCPHRFLWIYLLRFEKFHDKWFSQHVTQNVMENAFRFVLVWKVNYLEKRNGLLMQNKWHHISPSIHVLTHSHFGLKIWILRNTELSASCPRGWRKNLLRNWDRIFPASCAARGFGGIDSGTTTLMADPWSSVVPSEVLVS